MGGVHAEVQNGMAIRMQMTLQTSASRFAVMKTRGTAVHLTFDALQSIGHQDVFAMKSLKGLALQDGRHDRSTFHSH